MNIVARKPKNADGAEYVVVDRGDGHDHRYVSATADPTTIAHGLWYWGHYFPTLAEALDHFDNRPKSLGAERTGN